MKRFSLLLVLASLSLPLSLRAQDEDAPKGIMGEPAPKWENIKWVKLPEGKESVDIVEYRGKVLVLLLFQDSTPFVHEESLPVLKKLIDHYSGNDEVAFVGIHAVGENRGENTSDKVEKIAEDYGLDIPLGHYVVVPEFPGVVGGYKPGSSPWWVIIDRKGIVEWNGTYLDEKAAIENLDKMIAGVPVE